MAEKYPILLFNDLEEDFGEYNDKDPPQLYTTGTAKFYDCMKLPKTDHRHRFANSSVQKLETEMISFIEEIETSEKDDAIL